MTAQPPTNTAVQTKVNVLLNEFEIYCPHFGSALPRWVDAVYARVPSNFTFRIFAHPSKRKENYRTANALQPNTRRWTQKPLQWLITRIDRSFPNGPGWLRFLRARLAWHKSKQYCLGFGESLFDCDVIHIHGGVYACEYVHVLKHLGFQGKSIVHFHNEWLTLHIRENLGGIRDKVDGIITCSEYLLNRCETGNEIPAEVVNNGFEGRFFKPDTKRARTSNTAPRIGYAGRVDTTKGLPQLIEAYELVLRDHPETELHIAGSARFGGGTSPFERQLHKQAKEINERGGHIEFTGFLDHDTQLPDFFANLDLIVTPSMMEEAFNMVVIESMACGTPCVAFDVGGIAEAAGPGGKLVPKGDVEALVDAIHSLIANDESLETLRDNGLAYVEERYSWDAIASDLFNKLPQLTQATVGR